MSARLTDAEDVMLANWWVREGGDYEDLALDGLTTVVERILTARLAEAEQAAGQRERERWVTAVTKFADERGVNVGDEDSEWWQGYRQAQRECWYDAQALRALLAQQHDGSESDV